MAIYAVVRKVDGREVYRYQSEVAVEWDGMGFATHDHVEQAAAAVDVPVAHRWLTKLDYMNRFTDAELAGIYAAAQVSPPVMVWLKKFEAATPGADGTAIDLADPRTIAGVQALEAAGLIASGRAAQILGGA